MITYPAILTRVVFTILVLTLPAFASHHAALNGTWTLIPTQSDFAGQPVIQSGTVTINEREGNLTVSRDFAYEGANKTFFYRYTNDGRDNATIHRDEVVTKTKWDHDVLKITTTRSGVNTFESYALAADGTMRVNVQGATDKPITLIFQRR